SLLAAIVSLGLVSAQARAEEATSDPEPTPVPGTMPAPATTTPAPEELNPPPPTGTMTPAPATQGVVCPPLTGPRSEADMQPGRGLRVTGAMFMVLGAATLIPGAVMTWWGMDHRGDPTVRNQDAIWITGAVATAVGGASFLAGIPMLAAGVHK